MKNLDILCYSDGINLRTQLFWTCETYPELVVINFMLSKKFYHTGEDSQTTET